MEAFGDWVFESLVKFGAIRDYSKNPKTGRGKPPKGNMTVQLPRISQLRKSSDPNEELWGIIAQVGLQSEGEVNNRTKRAVVDYSRKYADDPKKLMDAISKASKSACSEFKARYKENPK